MDISVEKGNSFIQFQKAGATPSPCKSSIFLPVKRKQVIFYEGHPALGVYWVHAGRVKVYKLGANGKSHILFFAEAGDVLGVECLLSGEEFTASGEMLEEGRIAFIAKEEFTAMLRDNIDFSLRIVEMLAKRISASNEERIHLVEGSVRERMARALGLLASRYGQHDENGTLIDLPLSREDLANMIGTSAGTVMRLLKDFKEEKAIVLRGRNIIVGRQDYLNGIAHL